MKKGIFYVIGMFMMVSNVEAKNGDNLINNLGNNISYNMYNNSVNFFENGIEFFIFTNGEFDFDARFDNRNIRIQRDFRGRITTIGNVFINYDRRGNVTRINDVLIRYHRGLLANVGDLRVRYNNWNNPVFYGNVRNFYNYNGTRFSLTFGDVCDYNDAYFSRNDFGRNYSQFREDHNFHYYRALPNANIGRRSTILKRRKPAVTNRQRFVRNNTNSYRKSKTNNREVSSRNSNQNRNVKRNTTSTSRNTNASRSSSNSRNSETKRNTNSNRKVDTNKTSTSKRSNTNNNRERRNRG